MNSIEKAAAAVDISPAAAATEEAVVNPWEVSGNVDYDKLIQKYGSKAIDAALLERFEKVTGHRPHPLLRRGVFFSHRYAEVLPRITCDAVPWSPQFPL